MKRQMSKIDVNLKLYNFEEVVYKTYSIPDIEYTQDTTIADLINGITKESTILCDDNSTITDGQTVIRYLIVNNKVKWFIPYDKCLVQDYVATYLQNNPSQILYLEQAVGLGKAGIEDVFDWISTIVSIISFSIDYIPKSKNWARQNLNTELGYIGFYDLDKNITSQDFYFLDDFCYRFNFDEECAKVMLEFYGYAYCSSKNIYYFVPALHREHINQFRESMNQ